MSEHSILPPSGAKAWKNCSLWVTMNEKYPQGATPESLEGEAAHWAAWEMFAGKLIKEGSLAPNGMVITDEMIDGAELICDILDGFSDHLNWNVEQKIHIPRIHDRCFGTPDAWSFSVAKYKLTIIDYKFGHKFVDEFENDQCVAYAAGILDKIATELGKPLGLIDQGIAVEIVIVQPRCFYRGASVRSWNAKASDLRAQINGLANAAANYFSNPHATKTNSACGNCPGRHVCPALQHAAYSDAETAFDSYPVELSPIALGRELRLLERASERLSARIEGLRESALGKIRIGERVPFYKGEYGSGRQRWTLPAEQIMAMGQMLNQDLSKPAVITPKQAIKKGVDENVIRAYSETPSGELRLIPDDLSTERKTFT